MGRAKKGSTVRAACTCLKASARIVKRAIRLTTYWAAVETSRGHAQHASRVVVINMNLSHAPELPIVSALNALTCRRASLEHT